MAEWSIGPLSPSQKCFGFCFEGFVDAFCGAFCLGIWGGGAVIVVSLVGFAFLLLLVLVGVFCFGGSCFFDTATFIPNHKFMTICLAQQQTRIWDRSHDLFAASQNTTEILLQGLLSKLVCGVETSVKPLFFCKTHSVVNITHQDFAFNVRPVRQHRISPMISVHSLVQFVSRSSKIATFWTMCTHLLSGGHLHWRLSIQLATRTHSCQSDKTI